MASTQASVFSAYRTGENRVTGSIVAVLQSLSLRRFQALLGDLAGAEDENLVKAVNQKSDSNAGIPDAEISASFRILIETKIVKNAVDEDQLRRHLARFAEPTKFDRLVVLTPDVSTPAAIARVNSTVNEQCVLWCNFKELAGKIIRLLETPEDVISEREEFLLRHLLLMFEEENLLNRDREVVVVAARRAWPTYNRLSAYICQPNRSLGGATHLAFYVTGHIEDGVPKILDIVDDIAVGEAHKSPDIRNVLSELSRNLSRSPGQRNQIVLLSAPDSKDTVKLSGPIVNTLRSKQQPELPVAFTMGQRYVSLSAIKLARTTTDLLEAG